MAKSQLFQLHASICRLLANPKRLEIIDALRNAELPVNDLAGILEISQANLSQHLALMRQGGDCYNATRGLECVLSLEQS